MTTNPYKGDTSLEVAGKVYTLRYNHAALVKLEKQTGSGLFKIMQELADPAQVRVSTVSALLWAGLQKHHSGVTPDQATDLLDDIEGGMTKVMEVLGEAFERSFNAPGTKGTHPPVEADSTNGTGMPSLSNTSASATTLTPSGRSPPESSSST